MTTAAPSNRPEAGEFDPYYARYIDRVPDGDIAALLESQIRTTAAVLRAVPAGRGNYRYAEGKWSIAEVVGHMVDLERIFGYRALRIARADPTPIEGFDQNGYVPAGEFDRRPLPDLVDEFEIVRRSTLALIRGLPPVAWTRMGVANQAPISTRALIYVIAGHERDHLGTLRARYGIE